MGKENLPPCKKTECNLLELVNRCGTVVPCEILQETEGRKIKKRGVTSVSISPLGVVIFCIWELVDESGNVKLDRRVALPREFVELLPAVDKGMTKVWAWNLIRTISERVESKEIENKEEGLNSHFSI